MRQQPWCKGRLGDLQDLPVLPCYQLYGHGSVGCTGGGVALYMKDYITCNSMKILWLWRNTTEFLQADIPFSNNKNIVLGMHYQTPHRDNDSHQKMLSESRKLKAGSNSRRFWVPL